MKKLSLSPIYILAAALIAFAACNKKDSLINKPTPPSPVPPAVEDTSTFNLKLKAEIKVGDVMYDSIPASLTIISIDSQQVSHQSQINLAAGVNAIQLSNKMLRFELKLSKWGITREISLTKQEAKQSGTIVFSGQKAAKKLLTEASFILAGGAYQPQGRSDFFYNANGSLKQIEFWQKKPQVYELLRYHTDKFIYVDGRVETITRYDAQDAQVGYSTFLYDANGKISNMYQEMYAQQTGVAVEYSDAGGLSNLDMDFLFGNGQTMTYNMKFKNGNKIADGARSSTGAGEGGSYGYDHNINPYKHMNWPDLYMSHASKNNLVKQEKSFGGAIPSAVPYKFEYQYDADGYPIELIKSFKSGMTGEHLYTVKTVYTY
jgi:hypothetical protein